MLAWGMNIYMGLCNGFAYYVIKTYFSYS